MMIGGGVILLVLVLGFFLTRGGGGNSTAAARSGTTPVVVALQTVPQGTVFKSGQSLGTFFSVKQVPPSLVPFGAYTSVQQIENLTHVSGCGPVQANGCQGEITSGQTIYENTPVVSGMFSNLGQYRQNPTPAFSIPYGYVGIAVNFDAANSVLGSVQAGDDIDLIASWRGGRAGELRAPGETQFALNDVRVISVNAPPTVPGQSASSSPVSATAPSAAANTGGSVILLVRYQQALVIQHLKDFGWQLSCVLRSAKETDIEHFKTLPVTDKWFFAKTSNGFKVNPGY